ncbi:hypothetical protein C7999DRAFT_15349 [Corynascus novoguineensis]|uniref:Uncharacterized protein n=1 Tax=Corynascus novoguineensis TaxID=1126955 RepID=A0AAN7CTF1_9PEZI|nr:hypothetical protein C7999DRAFT_15349 [Corynascus novoguineensis]
MEALKNLITNVPDWLKKLDELNGQIEQRQIELAKLGDEKTNSADGRSLGGPKSVRNKGSTESLRPRDEPAAHPTDPRPQTDAENAAAATASPNNDNTEQPAPPSPSESQSPSEIQRLKSQMRAAGQARARATLRKRQRTDSVISAEGATPKYRSRCMIIVYYDSYVQLFFEELVKFVSAGRNMMRKAKMAAKVAQIKRLAELETPDDQSDAPVSTSTIPAMSTTTSTGALVADSPIVAIAADATAATTPSSKPAEATTDELQPAIHFVSTRRMGPGPGGRVMRPGMYPRVGAAGSRAMRSGGGAGGPGYMLGSASGAGGDKERSSDVYDELDRGLEYVQSMCEHAAHQFLRDGDCGEEVANIKRRLAETKELADREMERVRREDPDALAKIAAAGAGDDATGMAAARSYRPQSMRKVVGKPAAAAASAGAAAAAAASTSSPAAGTGTGTGAGSTTPTPALDESAGPLEVDEGVGDVDGEVMPKLVWKSTRMMR